MQRRFTVSYNKPTNNSRRPPRGAYFPPLPIRFRRRRIIAISRTVDDRTPTRRVRVANING
ncbi:MAG: hypothetical protein ACMX3H_03225 [Sodalis sp. (in: enterobacteria)]|uniref:hypothetical protein n=1 Tax=Sodalis sp. (in: enterobacteria) TaxID=1898979 RepID=UPI0039E507F8